MIFLVLHLRLLLKVFLNNILGKRKKIKPIGSKGDVDLFWAEKKTFQQNCETALIDKQRLYCGNCPMSICFVQIVCIAQGDSVPVGYTMLLDIIKVPRDCLLVLKVGRYRSAGSAYKYSEPNQTNRKLK